MLVIYASRTGNSNNFIKKTNLLGCINISNIKEPVNQSYILLTYTTGLGEVPEEVKNFLRINHSFLRGVIGNGNKNFGDLFALAADKISKRFKVPVLMKFELSGNNIDIKNFTNIVSTFKELD